MTILELREKRAKAWEAAKAFLDSHRKENGVLSAEDDAAYTKMEQCSNISSFKAQNPSSSSSLYTVPGSATHSERSTRIYSSAFLSGNLNL